MSTVRVVRVRRRTVSVCATRRGDAGQSTGRPLSLPLTQRKQSNLLFISAFESNDNFKAELLAFNKARSSLVKSKLALSPLDSSPFVLSMFL